MHIKYYGRANCELCVEGLRTLKLVQDDLAFEIEIIDIEENDAINEKYMLMIPVVEKEGRILKYGYLDYATLLEALE
ncbi:glutaredoxin family protein [Lysinibacillus sp. NPDC096418]|uniref:glutaredoxin family protein n=1 Tax=Lysinibacillus sp. NPDC096418 TaxID=3364138 RepID=UPI0037F62197